MGHSAEFYIDQNLIRIQMSGSITYDEEVQTILETLADPRMQKDARFLVDRTRATMTSTPETVGPLIGLVHENFAKFGKPKIAIVVSDDYGFAMNRMLELTSVDKLPHDFMVFREIAEACEWLGVECKHLID